MHDTNKIIAIGVVIGSALMIISYLMPASGIAFGDAATVPSPKTTQSSIPATATPPRSGGGCGV